MLDTEGDKQFLANYYSKALTCYQQAFEIRSKEQSNFKQSITASLYNLATTHEARKEYNKAKMLYVQALNILTHKNQSKYNEFLGYITAIQFATYTNHTEKQLQSIHTAFKQLQTPHNIRVAAIEHRLALLHQKQSKNQQAETSFKKTLSLTREHLEGNHPYHAKVLFDYAKFLEATDKKDLAYQLIKQANLILKKYPKKSTLTLYKK